MFQPNNVSIRQRVFGEAGLARTKENFPALGAEGGDGSGAASVNEGFSSKITASTLLKSSQPSSSSSSSQPSTSMMIHVSNRPSTSSSSKSSVTAKKSAAADFPALPGKFSISVVHLVLSKLFLFLLKFQEPRVKSRTCTRTWKAAPTEWSI